MRQLLTFVFLVYQAVGTFTANGYYPVICVFVFL